jgi:predicted aspartyl protease
MFVIVSAVGPDKISQTDGQLHAQAASQIPALIDTGATESCIDDALAKNLGRPLVDKHLVSGVGGQHVVDVYLGYVFVPSLNVVLTGLFCGVHLTAGGQFHQVLLGRTMLQNVVMIYDGVSGTVTLAN